jgi:4'-phosphopantetheinyl transferase
VALADAGVVVAGRCWTSEPFRLDPGGSAAPADVRVWRISGLDSDEYAALAAALDEQERTRAARFRWERDRRLHVTARGASRVLLAAYLGVEPVRVRFRISERGKPRLAEPFATSGWQFNCAHSGDMVLVAIARGCDVGIDVERPVDEHRIESLADSFATPHELEAIRALPREARPRRLYEVWARKEAALKAVGCALAAPVTAVHVGADADARSLRVRLRDVSGAERSVVLSDVDCGPDHVGAVAAVAGARAGA